MHSLGPAPKWQFVKLDPEAFNEIASAERGMVNNIWGGGHSFDEFDWVEESRAEVKFTQDLIDALWVHLSGKYDLEGIPKPTANLFYTHRNNKHLRSNAFIMPINFCLSANISVEVQQEDQVPNEDQKYPPSAGLLLSGLGSYPMINFEDPHHSLRAQHKSWVRTVMTKSTPCSYTAEDPQLLTKFVDSWNYNTTGKCFFEQPDKNSSDLVLREQCTPNTSPLQLRLWRRSLHAANLSYISFQATSDHILFSMDLVQSYTGNPDGLLAIVAHEVAHYLRGHAFTLNEYHGPLANYFYIDDDRIPGERPKRDRSLEPIGRKVKSIGRLNWTHPDFFSAPLDPLLARPIDRFALEILEVTPEKPLIESIPSYRVHSLEESCSSIEVTTKESRFGDYRVASLGANNEACVEKCTELISLVEEEPFQDYLDKFTQGSPPLFEDVAELARRQMIFLECAQSLPMITTEAAGTFDQFRRDRAEELGIEDELDVWSPMSTRYHGVNLFGEYFDGITGRSTHQIDDLLPIGSFTELFEVSSQLIKEDRSAIDSAMSMKVREYHREQEADEIAAIWLAEVGAPNDVLKSRRQGALQKSLQDGASENIGSHGEISDEQCTQLAENNWQDENGDPIQIPLGNFEHSHHPDCFRLYRLDKFVQEHIPILVPDRPEQLTIPVPKPISNSKILVFRDFLRRGLSDWLDSK